MIFILVVKSIGLANPLSTTAMIMRVGDWSIPAQKYANHARIYINLESTSRYFGFILSLIYATGIERLSFAAASTAQSNQTIHILSMICSIYIPKNISAPNHRHNTKMNTLRAIRFTTIGNSRIFEIMDIGISYVLRLFMGCIVH